MQSMLFLGNCQYHVFYLRIIPSVLQELGQRLDAAVEGSQILFGRPVPLFSSLLHQDCKEVDVSILLVQVYY